MYNVLLRRVGATIAVVKYCILRVRVCSLTCPEGNAHELYFLLLPARLYHNFPHYLINCMMIIKKVIEHKMWVLIFTSKFV